MAPEESFYLRMLAGNSDEASGAGGGLPPAPQPCRPISTRSLWRGLALAQLDVNRGRADRGGPQAHRHVCRDLHRQSDDAGRPRGPRSQHQPRDGAGRLAKQAGPLRRRPQHARPTPRPLYWRTCSNARASAPASRPSRTCRRRTSSSFNATAWRVICVSYLETRQPQERTLSSRRRLRKRMPGLPLIAGFLERDRRRYPLPSTASRRRSAIFLANNLRQGRRPDHRTHEEARVRGPLRQQGCACGRRNPSPTEIHAAPAPAAPFRAQRGGARLRANGRKR